MALRQCEKCNEMVDPAKAFCPGCGQPLVEEETRVTSSNFDSMDLTAQIGQTMYNQMLSDMGLNISPTTEAVESRVEVLEPIQAEVKPAATNVDQAKSSGSKKWIIIGLVALLVLFMVVIVCSAAGFIYWFKFR